MALARVLLEAPDVLLVPLPPPPPRGLPAQNRSTSHLLTCSQNVKLVQRRCADSCQLRTSWCESGIADMQQWSIVLCVRIWNYVTKFPPSRC